MVQKLGKSKIAKHIRKVIHLFHKPKTESATISPRKQKKLNARLLESAENGSSDEEIRRLLKAGADVNAKNENDETALREATEDNYIETCKLLIENGADLNAKDWHTETALMLAAGRGHNEIARMLIEKGADVNAKTRDGNTALMIATRNGRNEIARMLIEKGADVNAKVVENGFYKGRTSLMIAADNKADAYTCKTLLPPNQEQPNYSKNQYPQTNRPNK